MTTKPKRKAAPTPKCAECGSTLQRTHRTDDLMCHNTQCELYLYPHHIPIRKVPRAPKVKLHVIKDAEDRRIKREQQARKRAERNQLVRKLLQQHKDDTMVDAITQIECVIYSGRFPGEAVRELHNALLHIKAAVNIRATERSGGVEALSSQ